MNNVFFEKEQIRNRINQPHKSERYHDYIVEWIKEYLIPIKSASNIESSYRLKHCFSDCLKQKFRYFSNEDFYIDNGEFKYAMLEAGFEPYKDDGVNAYYKISRKSPGLNFKSY